MASQSSNGNTVTVNVGALSTAIAVAIQQAIRVAQRPRLLRHGSGGSYREQVEWLAELRRLWQ